MSRREFNRNTAALGLFSFVDHAPPQAPEKESFKPPTIGDVVRDEEGHTYFIQNELQGATRPSLYRRELPGFTIKQPPGFPKSHFIPSSLLRSIPEIPLPEYPNNLVEIWDGSEKQYAPGAILYFFMGGLHTTYRDNTFTPIQQALGRRFGVDRRLFLDGTYAERDGKPVRYTDKDTLVYPPTTKNILSKQIYTYKEQMPGIKVFGFGHSNGGWELLELAAEHPDFFAGIFLYHGVLAGAGNPIIPQQFEDSFIQFFAGDAGTFHVRRGADPNVLKEVEKMIDDLYKMGVFTVTHSSTKDPFVDARFSVIRSAQTQFGPIKTTPLAPLETRTEWDVLKNIPNTTVLEPDLASSPSETSAQLAKFQTDVSNHGAAPAHPRIIGEDIQVIDYILNTVAQMSMQEQQRAKELLKSSPDAFLQFLITAIPDMADTFSLQRFGIVNRPSTFTVTIKTADFDTGRMDAMSWLRSTGLTDEQIPPLKVTFQMEQVAKMKEQLFRKEEDQLRVETSFILSYDKVFDLMSVTFRNRSIGEPAFDRLLRSYGITDRRWINNFSVKDF